MIHQINSLFGISSVQDNMISTETAVSPQPFIGGESELILQHSITPRSLFR